MGENANAKAPKKSWTKGLKAEFKKIVWPDKRTIIRETAAVVIITVILGLVIAVFDYVIGYGVSFLVNL